MPSPTAVKTRVRIGITSLLDTHADVIAVTGCDDTNVVPWRDAALNKVDGRVRKGLIAYWITSATRVSGLGDPWRTVVQLSAFAKSQDTSDRLIEIAIDVLTNTGFQGLTPTLRAFVTDVQERDGTPDDDAELRRADADITLTVQK